MSENEGDLYAVPEVVTDPGDCSFYHVMELPEIGLVGGQWDLRLTVDRYLGGFNFEGKRALDVGTASGFLTFEMESRGASVVSVDLVSGDQWDIVPYVSADFDLSQELLFRQRSFARLKRAYWLAHRLLQSRAAVYYGNIYELPSALGLFDVVVLGSILLHVRDPFKALQSACRLSRGAVIVTDVFFDAKDPIMQFVPDWTSLSPRETWWRISETCMVQMLKTLGFPDVTVTRAEHRVHHHKTLQAIECSTYVGRRSPGGA